MTAPHSTSSPDDTPRKIDINLIHVAAAALAAVTAAVLGSTLGAAGTIIGAAGASMITTVGTAVYESSLRRSREGVRSLAHRAPPPPCSPDRSRTDRSRPAAANAVLSDEQLTDSIDSGSRSPDRSRWFVALRWGAVLVGALGAFLLALIFITGYEWASGETVGGNGEGTTIGQVIDNPPSPRNPPASPLPQRPGAPSSEIPTQTPSEIPTPETSTTTPDGSADVEPSAPKTSERPRPSEVTPTPPPLIPPVLPGVGS